MFQVSWCTYILRGVRRCSRATQEVWVMINHYLFCLLSPCTSLLRLDRPHWGAKPSNLPLYITLPLLHNCTDRSRSKEGLSLPSFFLSFLRRGFTCDSTRAMPWQIPSSQYYYSRPFTQLFFRVLKLYLHLYKLLNVQTLDETRYSNIYRDKLFFRINFHH